MQYVVKAVLVRAAENLSIYTKYYTSVAFRVKAGAVISLERLDARFPHKAGCDHISLTADSSKVPGTAGSDRLFEAEYARGYLIQPLVM
jgi:hypothetical protein